MYYLFPSLSLQFSNSNPCRLNKVTSTTNVLAIIAYTRRCNCVLHTFTLSLHFQWHAQYTGISGEEQTTKVTESWWMLVYSNCFITGCNIKEIIILRIKKPEASNTGSSHFKQTNFYFRLTASAHVTGNNTSVGGSAIFSADMCRW